MSTTTAYPASTPQKSLIARLLAEKDLTGTKFEGFTAAPEGLTGGKNGTASAAIEALFALPRKAAGEQPKPGFYVMADSTPVKVQQNKAKTGAYGLVWTGHSWDYAPGIGKTMVGLDPMTAEQAALAGLASGHCIACAKPLGGETLTAQVAALVGYGEICAGRHGWAFPKGAAAQRAYIAGRQTMLADTNH